MSRVDILFTVSNQVLSQDYDNPSLHSGDKNHFYAVFDLEDAFKDFENLKAAFVKQGRAIVISLVKNDADKFECLIPWETMETPGFFTVGIFGGDMMLTNAVSVRVAQGCTANGGKPLEPTPGWFDLIESQLKKILDAGYITEADVEEILKEKGYATSDEMNNALVEGYADATITIADGQNERFELLSSFPGIKYQLFIKEDPLTESPLLMNEPTIAEISVHGIENVIIRFFTEDETPVGDMKLDVMHIGTDKKTCRLLSIL